MTGAKVYVTADPDSAHGSAITELIGEFRRKRDLQQSNTFRDVFTRGLQWVCAGVLINVVLYGVSILTTDDALGAVLIAVSLVSEGVAMIGAVLISTVDPKKVDFDEVMCDGERKGYSRGISCGATVCFALLGLGYGGYSDVVGVLGFFWSFHFLVPESVDRIPFTAKVVLRMLLS